LLHDYFIRFLLAFVDRVITEIVKSNWYCHIQITFLTDFRIMQQGNYARDLLHPWRKKIISKKVTQILVDKQQQQQDRKEKGIYDSILLMNHSSFIILLLERHGLMKRPTVRVTGSHRYSCIFGGVSIEEKQVFREYDIFYGDTFL
jgi:hypothetical protein